jgi:hypothetical protein
VRAVLQQRAFNTFLAAALGAGVLAGCGSSFYASESDARVLNLTLDTGDTATELLADLPTVLNGAPSLEVLFDNSSGSPRVANLDNLRETLRNLGDLRSFEQNNKEIDLERLAAQLDERFNSWLAGHLDFYNDLGGSEVRITRLDRVAVRLNTPLTVTYDAAQSAVHFQGSAWLDVRGAINVNILGGFPAVLASLASSNPNGDHDVEVLVSNLPISGQLRLLPSFYPDASRVQLHIDSPAAAGLAIQVNAGDSGLNTAIRNVFSRQLTPTVDAEYELAFDDFMVSNLRIRGDGSLGFEYHPLPVTAEANADLLVRDGNGGLLHARKRGHLWNDFTLVTLPGAVGSDPALIESGPGELAMAALSSAGDLYVSRWHEGAWDAATLIPLPHAARISPRGEAHGAGNSRPGARHLPPPRAPAVRPVLLASGRGQLEIVAVDPSGAPWHLRRLNGVWQPAQRLHVPATAHLPLLTTAAEWVGSKLVLLYVDAQNQLYVTSFDLGHAAWSNPETITTGGVRFAPTLAACADSRLDFVYVAADGTPQHQTGFVRNDGILSIGAARSIGGTLNASPLLVCSGYQQMELAGRGTDNVFYYNHFVGPQSPQGLVRGRNVSAGWQGWSAQSRAYLAFFPIFPGAIGPAMALASSRAGDVQVTAAGAGDGAQWLYENRFMSSRFGRSSWPAVEWRGFAQIGHDRVVGTPAMIVSDRTLELACSGAPTVRVNDGNVTAIEGAAAAGADPVVLSSGPGAVDTLWLDPVEGAIREERALNGSAVPLATLQAPGLTIRSFTATTGVGTQIDVVGVDDRHALYHWRRVAGEWQGPNRISFSVAATPAPQPHVPPSRQPTPARPPPATTTGPRNTGSSPAVTDGQVTSRPVLVATGADQLELLATGGEHFEYGVHPLYRWRFANGQWGTAQAIASDFVVDAGKLTPVAAAGTGEGIVDVVLVDMSGAMYQLRLLPNGNLATWASRTGTDSTGHFATIAGQTIAPPALLPWSTAQQTLLAVGTDSLVYENRAVPYSGPPSVIRLGTVRSPIWQGFRPLAGTALTSLAAVGFGREDLALSARTADGSPYVARSGGAARLGFVALPSTGIASAQATCPASMTIH